MKILATSDIHGDSRWVKELAIRAEKEKVDLVLLCGDLTYAEEFSENLIGPFKEKGLKVALIPGNHESMATANFLSEKYGLKNLQYESMKIGNVGLFGMGGAAIGPFPVSEDEILDTLKKNFEKIKDAKTKIMVTHAHPKGTLIEKMSYPGSPSVRKAIESFKPQLHLCGHIQECAGMEEKIGETKVINVGKKGKIIEIK
ncbi:metallophosphoesterase [Candidatus Woesearchaeota archaeon]|nr:metallophosphoesterase [Candidatus Woesearchaeota archaeon]